MLSISRYSLGLLTACLLATGVTAAEKGTSKESASFGVLTAPSETSVRVKAAKWLKDAGKYDTHRAAFDKLWADTSKPLLDKLAETFALGDPAVAQMLSEARDRISLAPTALPDLLKDTKQPVFFRANLALAYAKALASRRVYEEGLETLKLFKPEQTVDPASFLFHRAVCEHGLMLKQEANETIARLLDDVPGAPERYKMVATLMHFDMVTWQERSITDKLASIGRRMEGIQRRLDLARGGQQTQKQQKEVVRRLDELIKELENANKDQQGGGGNGGNCPSGGQQGGKDGSGMGGTPMQDSNGGQDSGPGEVDAKRIKEAAEQWGKLPPREREALMRELTAKMSPRYAEVVKEYFRKLTERTSSDK